jgi:hypothetical protein
MRAISLDITMKLKSDSHFPAPLPKFARDLNYARRVTSDLRRLGHGEYARLKLNY